MGKSWKTVGTSETLRHKDECKCGKDRTLSATKQVSSLLVHCVAQYSPSTLLLALPCFCDDMSSDSDETDAPYSKAGENGTIQWRSILRG